FIRALLPTIVRTHSLAVCSQNWQFVCAAWFGVAALVKICSVAFTPGFTVTLAFGPLALLSVIGELWMPSMLVTVIVTGAVMSIENWPLASVVREPMPGTLTTRPTTGVLTSAAVADWPVRVHAITVTVVATGASGPAPDLGAPDFGVPDFGGAASS